MNTMPRDELPSRTSASSTAAAGGASRAALVLIVALLSSVVWVVPASANGIVSPPTDLAVSERLIEVGDRLTIIGGDWTPRDATVTITWFVDGVEVTDPAEAADPTDLQIPPAWLGRLITVELHGSAPGYLSSTTILRPSAVSAGWWHFSLPTRSMVARVGEPYTMPALIGLPPDVTVEYRWHIEGNLVVGATGPTFTPTPDQAGRAFGVTTRLTRPGYISLGAGGGIRVEPSSEYRFFDYRPTDPFYREVVWAVDTRTMNDSLGQMFYPERIVNRAQAAEYLHSVWLRYFAAPTCPPGSQRMFTDVPIDHPQCAAIEKLAAAGIITGWPDGTFRPQLDVSRQAMAAFMSRLAGGDAPVCTGTRFNDVTLTHPYCREIEKLASKGIINGYTDGSFGGGKNITRHAAAAFLFRFDDAF